LARTWLYRIATNTCLTALEGRTRRVPSRPSAQTTILGRCWIVNWQDNIDHGAY
jgi:DNA-directed RNA polymerase specialized sigma24 family protein